VMAEQAHDMRRIASALGLAREFDQRRGGRRPSRSHRRSR